MRVFAVVLVCILDVWFLLDRWPRVCLAVAVLSIICLMALPYARTHQHAARATCILALVAIIGFLGVRLRKPFLEGFMANLGPGSVADQIFWISREIDAFKKDHGGRPPSPRGLWDILLRTSDSSELGDTPARGTTWGPYISFGGEPINQLNGKSAVADKPAPGVGWVYKVNGTDYTLSAVNATGTAVLSKDEANLYYFFPWERAYVASQRARNNWGGLVFGIPLVVYWLAPFAWLPSRRSRRMALGLCPICGYDLRAHHPGQKCPECGTEVPQAGWRSGVGWGRGERVTSWRGNGMMRRLGDGMRWARAVFERGAVAISSLETGMPRRKKRLLVAAVCFLALAALPLGYRIADADKAVVLSFVTAPPAERTFDMGPGNWDVGSVFGIGMHDLTVSGESGEIKRKGRSYWFGLFMYDEWVNRAGGVITKLYSVKSMELVCLFLVPSIGFFLWFWRIKPTLPSTCTVCGYALRAHVAGQRCPGCGAEIPREAGRSSKGGG